MSHWDADHAGGIAALCGNGRTERIYTSYVPSDKDSDKDVEEFFDSLGDPDIKARYLPLLSQVLAGDRIVLSDCVYIDVLYPSERSGGGNEASMVLMLHIIEEEDTSILFTGDIGINTESYLINSGLDLDCDILKVAHHGSKY
jgi:beta-lactamase superfamily II metal-dependent hydrolase